MIKFNLLNFIILIVSCLWLSTANAHKVKIFVTAEGQTFNGYVYFPGGGRASQATVTVTTPVDTQPLATLQTDDEGQFTYTTHLVADHLFTVDIGDGHRATYTVKAVELKGEIPKTTTPVAHSAATSNAVCSQEKQTIEKIIYQQIQPLREQLEQYEEKIRLHDLLGGIGYIFGIFGLLIYLRQRHN